LSIAAPFQRVRLVQPLTEQQTVLPRFEVHAPHGMLQPIHVEERAVFVEADFVGLLAACHHRLPARGEVVARDGVRIHFADVERAVRPKGEPERVLRRGDDFECGGHQSEQHESTPRATRSGGQSHSAMRTVAPRGAHTRGSVGPNTATGVVLGPFAEAGDGLRRSLGAWHAAHPEATVELLDE